MTVAAKYTLSAYPPYGEEQKLKAAQKKTTITFSGDRPLLKKPGLHCSMVHQGHPHRQTFARICKHKLCNPRRTCGPHVSYDSRDGAWIGPYLLQMGKQR